MRTTKYCMPREAGIGSEAATVGRYIGKLMDALDTISTNRAEGAIVYDCIELRDKILFTLRAEGWRITVNRHDNWQVLPPKGDK